MGRYFNITGVCYPEDHYMVNMDSRVREIRQLIDRGEYFTINRGCQYGKTTTLRLLAEKLSNQYAVLLISFEGMEDEAYETAATFCQRFCRLIYKALLYSDVNGVPDSIREELKQMRHMNMDLEDLSDFILELCARASAPVVLMIDEVDQASNHRIFITFLGLLRKKFLMRKQEPAFQSVILAGVYDIKNLKLRIRPDMEHQYNSPWNIASDFDVDMNFSIEDIAAMLEEYERDYHTGMDISIISKRIYDYTSGYPFLVSRLCKLMDEQIPDKPDFRTKASAWTTAGVTEAVKELLSENNTLFDDMVKKLGDFPELKRMLHSILLQGERIPYNADNYVIDIGHMFGFLRNDHGTVAVSNRIFETRLYNLFLSEGFLDSKYKNS